MKWELEQVDQYVQAREFVDTALIPLVELKFGETIKESVSNSTFVVAVANGIEDQLKGRVLLLPSFTIYGDESESSVFDRLNRVDSVLKKEGLKNVVFLTQNPLWKERQDNITSDILILKHETNSHTISPDDIQKVALKSVPFLIEIWQKG